MKRLLFLILLLPCIVYGQTVGIKVASPIIKNSPSDNTVTGYANLLNGGYHTVGTISGRDSLVTSYSKTLNTGMLVYVNNVDSTYRWSGTDWTAVVSGGGSITPEILSDSLQNYTPLQDGLISGGSATIGTGSVTIDTAYYRINRENKISLPRTFTGISNSASGTQYYILVYGKSDNTLDTLYSLQDTISAVPTAPSGTVAINNILVGDGGVVSAEPDLTGYALLNEENDFTKRQGFLNGISSIGRSNFYSNTTTDILELNGTSINGLMPGGVTTSNIVIQASGGQFFYGDSTVSGNEVARLSDIGGSSSGTVTSITPSFGLTPNTPITTSGTFGVDSTQIRTVANSYSLASGQPRLVSGTNIKTINSTSLLGSTDIPLEVPLTFGYALTRSTNTITSDTTSGTGLVSKTRLTGALASKQGLDATLTALASYNTNGILTQTGADTFTGRTLTGTTNQVIITNGSGVSGNPTFSLPQDINTTSTPQFARIGVGSASSSSSALLLPAGTTSISSLRLPNGVAPTSPVSGDIWGLTSGVRLQRYDGTQTKDFIFSTANFLFVGTGVRAVTSNPTGDIVATTPILSILVTDSDVITAITGASYTSDRATITPASSKVMYVGQIYDDGTYTYIAISDNVVRRW